MPGSLLPQPKQVAFDSAMNPGIAYQFYTYDVGTLTPKATYQDAALTIANTNPVIANGRGEVVMYGSGGYRVILKDALGSTIWDRDNVEAQGTASAALATSLAAAGGAALVGAAMSPGGAYLKTVSDILNGAEVSIHRFLSNPESADYKGGTQALDLTASMTTAHNTGARIYYPGGSAKFSTLSFAAGGIRGDGKGRTKLVSSDATSANIITFTGTGGDGAVPSFRDFGLTAANTKAAGAGIIFTPATGEIDYATIDSVLIYNMPRSLDFRAAAKFHLSNSDLLNWTDAGVFVGNTNNIDSGDSSIVGCFLNTGQASGNRNAIYQESGGGLKLTGNKILGGLAGYNLAFKGNTQSGPLLITGNSIENVAGPAIYLGHTATFTGVFGGIVIVGNEIAVCSTGISTDTSAAFVELTISANYINLSNGTGKLVNLNGVNKFIVSANTFVGGLTAIDIASNCANGKIGKNIYSGQALSTVANASTTTFVDGDIQSGTATVTPTTAYGSLFIGSTPLTFPTAFTTMPIVEAFVNGGQGGGLSASATNITKTGFTLVVAGVTSGGVVSGCTWNAQGVI